MIELTRGDTLSLEVHLKLESTGEEYVLKDNDKLVFTVKKSIYSDDVVIQKNIVSHMLRIEHEDTKDLNYGTYVYDVQLTFENGDICTVIKPDKFVISGEVNFDG